MRILYITTIGRTMMFFRSLIKELLDKGITVDIATNEREAKVPDCFREWGCNVFGISTSRSPFCFGNIKAVKQIRQLVEEYDIVHCHTPLASVCTRLACRKKNRTKVFYTAHGFHFFKGAPIKNWLIYCSVEKLCARWTDVLITINKEDYCWAKKHLNIKTIEYVPGVGIDVSFFSNTKVDKVEKRKELGIPNDAFVLLSVGELNKNKNHQVVIKSLSKIKNINIHYVIAGSGKLHDYLISLANLLGIKERLHLIGYRSDINEIYKISDVFVLPSIREGLNVSTMEAMASGLPCIVSKIRGNIDMVDNNGGCLCNPHKEDDFIHSIEFLYSSDKGFNEYNKSKSKMFSNVIINEKMIGLYNKELIK